MRILHVIPSISPLRGGPSQAVLAMVGALRSRGVDARILTTDDHGPGRLEDLPTGRWTQVRGVPVLAFRRWSPPLHALREFAFCPGLSCWLSRHLKDFDLLHVHAVFSYPSTAAMAQARGAGVPYLVRTIGQLSPWSLERSPLRKRWMLCLIERRNLEGAATLHFTSEAERREAIPLALAPDTLVLPLGVALPAAPAPSGPRPVEAPVRFLFLSRLHPKKQLERLLEAFALIGRQGAQGPWELRIAGSGEPSYVESLRQGAEDLGIAHRCRWLGHLQGAAKQGELEAADWFVLPSASENFGIAVVESLAAGTPVIVSPEVAVSEAVAAAGAGLVCPSDPPLLAACLANHLAPPARTMREAARNLASTTYAWDSIAGRLEEHYGRILRQPSVTAACESPAAPR